MPDRRFVVRLQGQSLLPEDVFENVLYFETDSPDGEDTVADGLIEAYSRPTLPLAGIASIEVRAYELGGGQPIFRKSAPLPSKGGAPGPTEVALCLSYTASDDVETATPRRRGRIYLGPFNGQNTGSSRPSAVNITGILDFGEALAQIGFAANTTWKMYSPTDQQTFKIERIYVDNAWDTQRRRGLAATNRTERDVQ